MDCKLAPGAIQKKEGMLVLIGGLLVVSFLYFVSSMRKDAPAPSSQDAKLEEERSTAAVQTSSPDEGSNMECSQSSDPPKFVCSRCGSRPMAIKIEERVEESTCEIIEESNDNNSYESHLHHYYNADTRRVPFPEAGVDIVDRKLKNTQESLEREIAEYDENEDNDILTYSETWTENWLFRKKDATRGDKDAFKSVSMFVPNTTAKYRAMIGDRDVDEMSDLSDCSEDSEEEFAWDDGVATRKVARNGLAKYIYDQRCRLLLDGKSKHHRGYNVRSSADDDRSGINGYCRFDDGGSDDGANANSLVAGEEKNTATDEERNNDDSEEAVSVESNRSYRSELFIETHGGGNVNQSAMSDDKLPDMDFHLFSPPKPGTIADREHRKWQTAAPMENNPYSEANLRKRLVERKYSPKYSSASSLLGIARINGLDDGTAVDASTATQLGVIDFESIDSPEKSPKVNDTPAAEKRCNNDTSDREDDAKNTSRESKCANSRAIVEATKKNARINEYADYASRDDDDDEKISLPSVRKLVEIFSAYQRARGIYVEPTKDKNNTTPGESEINRPELFERTQPRPLHLHSLTARSLSKEFREGLR